MDKEKALKILIANACCYTEKACVNCPFAPQNGAESIKDCDNLNEDIISEAIKTLNNS